MLITFSKCDTFTSSKLWFYSYSDNGTPLQYDFIPTSFLYLKSDKTFTCDFGVFDYGTWSKTADTITLKTSLNKTEKLAYKKHGPDLILLNSPAIESYFDALPAAKDTNADPFLLKNNKWRIKAQHKESIEEIKQRLIDHCKFWKLYFEWALNNNIATVDVRSTPTPIKIYGNGFILKNLNELPFAWKNYFYDEEDCDLASEILSNIIANNNIAWSSVDNKYKAFIGAFEQLENFLRKDKSAY